MTLRRVQVGDPFEIPAATFNKFVDAAVAHQTAQNAGRTDLGFGASLNAAVFPIKNNSASDLDRFGVLAIGGPIFSPTDNADEFDSHISFLGSTPGDVLGKFAVLQEPCKAGSIAKAVFFGICVAKVNILDTSHAWADVKSGDATSLESSHIGSAQILYKESGTGVKRALIRIGMHERQFLPALVTGSSPAYGKDYRWTYTVQLAECSAPGLDNWTAIVGTPSLTAYNLFEKVDRDTEASVELDPSGDGTDDGTIQAIEDDSLVMICRLSTTDNTGSAWYFERTNSILVACSE